MVRITIREYYQESLLESTVTLELQVLELHVFIYTRIFFHK